MSEVERLHAFYPFDSDILARTEQVARAQENVSWPEYARQLNLPEPFIFWPNNAKPIEVVDIQPNDYDGTLVYHLPMGCLLDSNMMIHLGTLAQVQFDKRIISISNPGQPGRGSGKLSLANAMKVWQGDLGPVVIPTLEYLDSEKIESASHVGISYGADKAAAAAEKASLEAFGQEVPKAIMIEPVLVANRGLTKFIGLVKLGLIFQSTSQHSNKYLAPVRERSQAFVSAEGLKESEMGYALGLLRLSNLAINSALAQEGFEGRIERALVSNRDMRAGIAWGTASEFDMRHERELIVLRLKTLAGEGRVRSMALSAADARHELRHFLKCRYCFPTA